MKKCIISLFTILSLVCAINIAPLSVNASDNASSITTEMIEDGYYFETIIEDEECSMAPMATTQYITKTKTTKLKNSNGDVMWAVSIKATFSYNGSTSKCTSCTPSATSYASAWSIKSVTSSKSGNSATATAIAAYSLPTGTSQLSSKSVTITCSATGVVS